MKITRHLQFGVIALVTGLAMTGCGAASNSSADGVTGARGHQTLRLTAQGPPSDFSIGKWAGSDPALFLSVYDTLLTRNQDGTLAPSIAESWSYSTDNLTLTLKIRGGMKFTNGELLDAAAVAASLEASRKGTSTSAQLGSIASVSVVDVSTVHVTLAQPDAALLPSLAGTAGAVGAPSVLTAESSKAKPVGSGAYVLDQKQTTVGSKYTLTRNPDNWNAGSYPFETVTEQVIQDSTASQNALKTGQLDFSGITANLASQFPSSDFTTGESAPTAIGSLWIVDRAGTIVPALKDLRVRQAINLAIDRESISTKLTPGSAYPTNQVLNPTGQAYSKDLLDKYKFDTAKARALMAAAGYAQGFSVTMPSTPYSTLYDATLRQELGDIGITVNYETVPIQDFYSKVFAGTYGMFFMYNGFSGSDAQDVNASLNGIFNPFHSTTPELQSDLAAANRAPVEKQGAAFSKVNEYLVNEAWFAPISYATGTWVASKAITYTPAPTGLQNLRAWKPAK